MTKSEIIELLAGMRWPAGSRVAMDHSAKLRAFTKAELEAFLEQQTDPANGSPFKSGDFVYCGWAGKKGIITHTEKVPGQDRYNIIIKTGAAGRIHTTTDDVSAW